MSEQHVETAHQLGGEDGADIPSLRREDRLKPWRGGINPFPAGPGHWVYGLSPSAAVERLTDENWRVRILARADASGWLILWVQPTAFLDENDQRVDGYRVLARGENGSVNHYARHFLVLEEALAYANGDDEGKIAAETEPLVPGQLPPDEPSVCRIILG